MMDKIAKNNTQSTSKGVDSQQTVDFLPKTAKHSPFRRVHGSHRHFQIVGHVGWVFATQDHPQESLPRAILEVVADQVQGSMSETPLGVKVACV